MHIIIVCDDVEHSLELLGRGGYQCKIVGIHGSTTEGVFDPHAKAGVFQGYKQVINKDAVKKGGEDSALFDSLFQLKLVGKLATPQDGTG